MQIETQFFASSQIYVHVRTPTVSSGSLLVSVLLGETWKVGETQMLGLRSRD